MLTSSGGALAPYGMLDNIPASIVVSLSCQENADFLQQQINQKANRAMHRSTIFPADRYQISSIPKRCFFLNLQNHCAQILMLLLTDETPWSLKDPIYFWMLQD